MKVLFVKKIFADGSSCKKCNDVETKLKENGEWHLIDNILVADERDASSPGMVLANELSIERAPFFVVEQNDGNKQVHLVYLKFSREVLQPLLSSNPNKFDEDKGAKQAEVSEDIEIIEQNDDLDFL